MAQPFTSTLHAQQPNSQQGLSNRPRYPCYRLRFGKYEGCTLTEVPAEYKKWLVRNKFHFTRPDLHDALVAEGFFGAQSAEQLQGAAFTHGQFAFEPLCRPANSRYVLNFGKHIGRSVSELPDEYKEWLVFHKYHLSRPELYEALEEDGYFQPKTTSPEIANNFSVVVEAPLTLGFSLVDGSHKRKRVDESEIKQSPMKSARMTEHYWSRDENGTEAMHADADCDHISDEIASWCRSNSSDLEWDAKDDFLSQFDMDSSFNVDQNEAINTFDAAAEQVLLTAAADDASDAFPSAAADHAVDLSSEEEHASAAAAQLEPGTEAAQRGTGALCERESVQSQEWELQAAMGEAFAAFEEGACTRALHLLRAALCRVTQLAAARGLRASAAERASMDTAVVTIVHAARMVAVNFRDAQTQPLIEAGDELRRAGEFDAAMLKYAQAVPAACDPPPLPLPPQHTGQTLAETPCSHSESHCETAGAFGGSRASVCAALHHEEGQDEDHPAAAEAGAQYREGFAGVNWSAFEEVHAEILDPLELL